MDGRLRAELGVYFPEEIDELGIHGRRLVLAPVAQDPVDPLHGGRHELAVTLVGDGDSFLGVDVVERDRALGAAVRVDRARADGSGGRAERNAGQKP